VSTSLPTAPPSPPAGEAAPEHNGAPGGSSVVESLFDNLSFWTVMAAAIGLLYLVWATLEILSRYVGPVPSFTP
jgi:hypothetical protein